MNPTIWGPHAWFFLHSVTLAYPKNPTEEDKKNVKQFFKSLESLLPCDGCKHNYKIHFKNNPLTDDKLVSPETLTKWLIDIHNDVNKLNGKKELTVEEVLSYYKSQYNKRYITGVTAINIVCYIALILIIVLILIWK